jgi:hypothetical protein
MRIRKHVLSDLQPYICTYPDCELHDHFFENENDWFHHESHTHRVEWFCNTASHHSFVDMQEFLDHMHTVHSEPLDQAQLLSLHRGFQRPSNAHSGTCTLCGNHASRLKSHIARHLEQLALFAIPQTDYMAALEEDDTSSNAARQGVASLSGSSTRGSIGTSSLGFSSQRSSLESDRGKPRTENGGLRLDAVAAASVIELYKHPTRKRRTHEARDQAQQEWQEEQLQVSPIANVQSIEEWDRMISDSTNSEEVDTSWDLITPKFKKARHAMYNEHEAGASELYITPSLTEHALGSDVKPRLTKDQHDILEQHFLVQHKPSTNIKKEFATRLGVPLDKINASRL